jgi:hypothetical protein
LLLVGVMDEMELSSISSMTPAAAISVENIRSCKYSQVFLMMGENITRHM